MTERGFITRGSEVNTFAKEAIEIADERVKWFAGMFEVGGAMYFGFNTKQVGQRLLTYTYPHFVYGDQNEEKMEALTEEFGGHYYRKADERGR